MVDLVPALPSFGDRELALVDALNILQWLYSQSDLEYAGWIRLFNMRERFRVELFGGAPAFHVEPPREPEA